MNARARIIDANMNRAREGLRVLEEVARFALCDEDLWRRAKMLRHALHVHAPHRDVASDVGAGDETRARDWIGIVNANAARVQEALRVLEELTGENRFSQLRFTTYTLHQELFLKLRHGQLSDLYAVVDVDAHPVSAQRVAHVVAERKAKLVQLRYKSGTKRQVLEQARRLRAELPQNVLLIVNDHVDVGLAVADGVHVGRHDCPVAEIVEFAPPGFIVGASANNANEAIAAQEAGASYVSMGCLFGSGTKSDTRALDQAEVQRARARLRVPLCVIGGVNESNMSKVLQLKPDMIAICAGLWHRSS